MSATRHVPAVAVLIALASAPESAAVQRPITGKLAQQGYTVIALSEDGRAASARVAKRRFSVRPRTRVVTLHLRAPDGTYAGPLVLRAMSRKAFLAVRSGTRLGAIRLRDGHAVTVRRVRRARLDTKYTARARRGVPIGARTVGRVRSKPVRRPVRLDDRDVDGVPDSLDVDDDGDLVLDNVDRTPRARGAQQEDGLDIMSLLGVFIENTVNANVSGLTPAQMDQALADHGALKIRVLTEGTEGSAELDCGSPQARYDFDLGGLVYCTRGGTGVLGFAGPGGNRPYPDDFDPDGDGFGELRTGCCYAGDFFLAHHARSDQIGTGDLLIQRVTRGGVETQHPATLRYVFGTTPALVSYSDRPGRTVTISYPTAGPVVVGDGPDADSDIQVTFTIWRPQRRPIAGEPCLAATPPCDWVDVGRLHYTGGINCVSYVPGTAGCGQKSCPPSTASTDDPNLVVGPPKGQPPDLLVPTSFTFADTREDAPSNPAATVTYTINVTQCVAAYAGLGIHFEPGEALDWSFNAFTPDGDFAQQRLTLMRE